MNAKEAKEIADKVNGVEAFIYDVNQLIKLDCERGRYHTKVFCDSSVLSRGAIDYFTSQGFEVVPMGENDFTVNW